MQTAIAARTRVPVDVYVQLSERAPVIFSESHAGSMMIRVDTQHCAPNGALAGTCCARADPAVSSSRAWYLVAGQAALPFAGAANLVDHHGAALRSGILSTFGVLTSWCQG